MKITLGAITFFVIMIFFYVIVNGFLQSLSGTPVWGSITHPQYILLSEKIPVSVLYKDIISPVQMHIKTIYRNKAGKYYGEKHYKDLIVILRGSGKKTIVLPAIRSDSIAQVRIRVVLFLERASAGDGSRNLEVFGKPIRSRWISVSGTPLTMDGRSPGVWDIISNGYQTGLWKTNRGDYSFSGWMITFFYICSFVVLLFVAGKSSGVAIRDKVFWHSICAIILFLSINKQLDIQMLFTDIARTAAKEYQVYAIRKPFQIRIISFFASMGISFFIPLMILLRRCHKSIFLATGGVFCLFTFLCLRLVSHHKVEAVFSHSVGIFTYFDFLELLGIFLVSSSAVWYFRTLVTSRSQLQAE